MQRLVVCQRCAPGDNLVLTGFVRDLALAHPGGYEIYAATPAPSLFDNNPHCKPAGRLGSDRFPGVEYYTADYGLGLHQQKVEVVHYLTWHHREFFNKYGVSVPVSRPTPDLHLAPLELTPWLEGRYWVVNAGGKTDFTTKVWPHHRFQAVADGLRERGIGCVQVGGAGPSGVQQDHSHRPLAGVVDMLGKTNLRQLIRLVKHADGVVCGVTMLMHMAAALDKPCVVVAGGREAWWWEAYCKENQGLRCPGGLKVSHRFLHTIGRLDCCERHGCWRSRVVPSPGYHVDKVCLKPADDRGAVAPACLTMIEPGHVLDGVDSYYEDGTLAAPADPVAPGTTPPPYGEPHKPLSPQPGAKRPVGPDPAFDNQIVGGKFTHFTLLYGGGDEAVAMHRKALEGLFATTDPYRLDSRVISNELCAESVALVDGYVASGLVTKHYRNADNRKKYPAMRAAFRDPSLPVETNYLVWADDDTFYDKDPDWLRKFAEAVTAGHPSGQRLFGPKRYWTLTDGQARWLRAGTWHKGRPFHDAADREVPDGKIVFFAVGAIWALDAGVMRAQDVPDRRLNHNGGDWTIGAQVQAAGWGVGQFSGRKEIVNWSACPRRGFQEAFPCL